MINYYCCGYCGIFINKDTNMPIPEKEITDKMYNEPEEVSVCNDCANKINENLYYEDMLRQWEEDEYNKYFSN